MRGERFLWSFFYVGPIATTPMGEGGGEQGT